MFESLRHEIDTAHAAQHLYVICYWQDKRELATNMNLIAVDLNYTQI